MELADRHVEADRVAAVGQHPAGALSGPAAQLEDAPPGDVPERLHGFLADPFGPPEEALVTEELAVGGLVLVRVAVPVRAVGGQGVLLVDGSALSADPTVLGHHATMMAPARESARRRSVGRRPPRRRTL
jgi:hypothetical protein